MRPGRVGAGGNSRAVPGLGEGRRRIGQATFPLTSRVRAAHGAWPCRPRSPPQWSARGGRTTGASASSPATGRGRRTRARRRRSRSACCGQAGLFGGHLAVDRTRSREPSSCRVNTPARKLGIVELPAACAAGPMFSVPWMWLVAAAVVAAVLAGLRFELVDFLLERFGAFTDWWMRRWPMQDDLDTRPSRGAAPDAPRAPASELPICSVAPSRAPRRETRMRPWLGEYGPSPARGCGWRTRPFTAEWRGLRVAHSRMLGLWHSHSR